MTRWILLLVFAGGLLACKRKKKEPQGDIFPVSFFLKQQVRKLDSIPYRFTRIRTLEGRSDTTPVDKATALALAAEFTRLEDLTLDKHKPHYQTANIYDSMMKSLVLTYTTNDADQPISRETVIMSPDSLGQPKVATILVQRGAEEDGKWQDKDYIWRVDQRFQISTKVYRDKELLRNETLILRWE